MIKKILLLAPFALYTLIAQEISVTPEQISNWQIKTAVPQSSKLLPLGEFVAQVQTPPTLMHTISLPFEAKIQTVLATTFQEVNRSQVLAKVSGTQWIEAQQKAIADAIEFTHHQHLAHRKAMLCKEEIIPKKECVAANAELKADKIKVMASKALLKSYGADDALIDTLFKTFTLSQNLEVKSTVEGNIIASNVTPGKSIAMSEALFVVQQKGDLWLESAIEAYRSQHLKTGQTVQINLGGRTFETTILHLSSVINPHNQTRTIRFLLPQEMNVPSGLRATIKISLMQASLKVIKESVIKDKDTPIVFVENKNGYTAVPVEILAEDETFYFLKPSPQVQTPIAVSSVAVLKNMLGSEDE